MAIVSKVNQSFLTEELFQHIWQFRLFQQAHLTTLEGEPVTVIHSGMHNKHAGPDFSEARIRIGKTLWAGNVELHLRTSDWYKHGHQRDLRYGNVVLHVVFEHDLPTIDTDGIPCVELQHCIPKLLLRRYERLKLADAFVPCAKSASWVSSLIWENWKERLMIERLEQKAAVIKEWLTQTRCNWEEVCYWAIAQAMGQPVNGDAFVQLARSVPFVLMSRYAYNPAQLDALLFGQAGMLEGIFTDEYPSQLQQEYRYLQYKHKLKPLLPHYWKWLRMRPAAFPGIRIASLGALLHTGTHLFSRILEAYDIPALEQLLQINLGPYWKQHRKFDVPGNGTHTPGLQTVHHLLINAVLPIMYLYGRETQLPGFQEKAIYFLNKLPAEQNSLIKGWNSIGVQASCAADTQALIQLKQTYCNEKSCLNCAIGAKLLKESFINKFTQNGKNV
jgi:hypothetical protein